MRIDDHSLWLALALALVLLGALVSLRLASLFRAWRARRRASRALRGEARAERLLASLGYVVEARQARGEITLEVDGRPRAFALRADLVVRRGGSRYVAEVKTGALAPHLESAATRRQLIEYALAYDVDAVLLVDVESRRVHVVRVP